MDLCRFKVFFRISEDGVKLIAKKHKSYKMEKKFTLLGFEPRKRSTAIQCASS